MKALLTAIMVFTFIGCVGLDDEGLQTESASSALTLCPALSAPVAYNPSGNTGDSTPLYSWSAVPGATSYTMYVLDPAENWADYEQGSVDTSYQGNDLSGYANVQLRWKVKAQCEDVNGYHASPYSERYFMYYVGGGGGGGTCYPSLKACLAACSGVCERRINCGGASAHKCFE
jgi:hypothetical protein